ncbi:diguanylate cyclase [Bacillus sp. FJAT-45350]|uniref:diguanylate cyclase n=1 Tax=Bacillus sp. FJAT-45350 TaxID=2011014 RepID=UPI00211C625F|nr:diguanylate cyclase [Bacillus sp. FJAT-45350]
MSEFIAERLRIKVAETPSPSGKPITISLGVSSFQSDDIHPKTIIERADSALYQSKADGRNRTTVFNKNRD